MIPAPKMALRSRVVARRGPVPSLPVFRRPGAGRLTVSAAAWLVCAILVPGRVQAADREYPVRGMVLEVGPDRRSIVVSHDDIPGFMSSMTMPFDVRADERLEAIVPGSLVDFTLVVGDAGAYVSRVTVRGYEPADQDPRVRVTPRQAGGASAAVLPEAVPVGARVPGVTLTSHARRPVSLADFAGKVVVLNFIDTHCSLAQFCPRMSSHFVALQRRFARELGPDLVLVSVTIDPARDTPDVLARYAASITATSPFWYFATGSEADVRRVGRLFGVDHLPNAASPTHSVRTAIINRQGMLAAQVEGNQFNAQQLGDLVLAVLNAAP